jgi:hypothetical protein
MPIVVPDAGERRLLEYIVNRTPATNLVLHLYSNNVNLGAEDFTYSSFTRVTGDVGSSAPNVPPAVPLLGANWTASTSAGISSAVYSSSITFSFSAAASIQGYLVTDTSNNILWAEEFPGAPFTLPAAGGEISIRPQVQLN